MHRVARLIKPTCQPVQQQKTLLIPPLFFLLFSEYSVPLWFVKNRLTHTLVSIALTALCLMTLTACGTSTPPLSLAPTKQLVEKAIALQISQTQQKLTQQLQAASPNIEISQVKLKQLEPLFLDDLPTYHVWGTYNLTLKLPQQKLTQSNNSFDVYLQRQPQGKTWRLALPEDIGNGTQTRWHTYRIPS